MSSALNLPLVEKGAAANGASLLSDVSLPALVLHREALEHNIRWMQKFVSDSGAELAPHGKTSMTPALFKRQLDAGAWHSRGFAGEPLATLAKSPSLSSVLLRVWLIRAEGLALTVVG